MNALAVPPSATSAARPGAPRAPAGDIPALDWQGRPITDAYCATCAHHDLRHAADAPCEPGHRCLQDAYARRIDRFLRDHPTLASLHLTHPYFEVRAIAARHVPLFQLGVLRDDVDETVRLQVALRLPQRQLLALCTDPHREVRIRVAHRLDVAELGRLLHDPDYEVRSIVARRAPLDWLTAHLSALADDPDEQVRCILASRLAMPALWRFAADAAPRVRREVAQRAPLALLDKLAGDADWRVRWEVAQRLDPATQAAALRCLAGDEDSEVRAAAEARLSTEGAPS